MRQPPLTGNKTDESIRRRLVECPRLNWANVFGVLKWCNRAGLFEGLAATGKFGNDGIDGRRPDEGFRVFVPGSKELVDGSDEISDAEESIAAQAFGGEFGEPAFNQVQPAAGCGHIVDDEAAMFLQPSLNFCGAVSPIVVHMVSDQQVKRLGRLSKEELSLEIAAAKAGMDPKTARKYLRNRRLPSEMQKITHGERGKMRFSVSPGLKRPQFAR